MLKVTTPSKKKPILIAALLSGLIVSAAVYLITAKSQQFWPFKETLGQENSIGEIENDKQKKEDATTPDNGVVDNNKTTDEIPTSTELTAVITQLEQSNSSVNFSANLQNSTQPGKCVLTFSTPNDKPLTKEFDAITKVGSTACGPVSISNLEFSYLGEWQVALRYYEAGKQVVVNGKINIQ